MHFLRTAAHAKGFSGPKLVTWPDINFANLNQIGIFTLAQLRTALPTVNTVLNANTLGTFPPSTMAVIQALASYHAPATPATPASVSPSTAASVPSPIASPARTALQPLLRSVAIQRGFHDPNIERWMENVHSKLLAINITTVDALYFALPTLNDDLESQGLVSLHAVTLETLNTLLAPLAFPASPIPSAHVITRQEGENQKRRAAKKRQHWDSPRKQPCEIRTPQTDAVGHLERQCCMVRVNLGFTSATDITQLRLNILEPAALRCSVKYEDTFRLIWDSGASICITHDKTDFVGALESAGALTYLHGVTKGLRIQGKGNVLWTILDIHGQLRTLKIPAYYVPQSNVRLLSTAALLQIYSDEEIRVDVSDDPTRSPVEAYLDPKTNLPTSTAYRSSGIDDTTTVFQACLASVSHPTINLSSPQN